MPFKKGQSGNPGKKFKPGNPGGGRPKKLPAIDVLMVQVLGTELKGRTEAEAILKSLLTKAKRGNVRAAEILLDRAYGKAKQTMDVVVDDHRKSVADLFPLDDDK